MKIQRYREFLGMMRPWEWPESFFSKPEKIQSLALAIQDYAGGIFQDKFPTDRPLGLMTIRLLWELAVLSHDKRRRQEVAEVFAANDELTLHWSLATPWGVTDLTDEKADAFLKEAVVMGDGLLSQSWILDNPAGKTRKPLGLRSRRAFDTAWGDQADGFRASLEGRGGHRPLSFAVKDDGLLGIFHCGSPWFGPADHFKASEAVVVPDALSHIAPEVFEKTEKGKATRWFIPGSETAAQIELDGSVALDSRGLSELAKAFSDQAPSIRVQFGYLPGWYVIPYGFGHEIVNWSDLRPEAQEEMEAEASEKFLF